MITNHPSILKLLIKHGRSNVKEITSYLEEYNNTNTEHMLINLILALAKEIDESKNELEKYKKEHKKAHLPAIFV